MSALLRNLRNVLAGDVEPEAAIAPAEPAQATQAAPVDLDIGPNDPLVPYFQASPGVAEVEKLNLNSPALRQLRVAGVKLVVPLVSQGELIGLLNLGPRLSEQEYSADDRALLNNLAIQAAPALRVAQLVQQQQAEARERERIDQELRVARLIQQTLLPKTVPQLQGWKIESYYQPARAVGGDFFDFVDLPEGRLGLVVGDVTDKGVPAALVMATTRTMVRASAERLVEPGQVLRRVNEVLCDEIPQNMFVTCLYAVLDPATAALRFANAGHPLPYRRSPGAVAEMRATGMPLGLMPGMDYEETEVRLEPGETVLLYSDGLIEAHSAQGEMFGLPRLQAVLTRRSGAALVEQLLKELHAFAGRGWEQEDDVTLVVLEYQAQGEAARETAVAGVQAQGASPATDQAAAQSPASGRQAQGGNPGSRRDERRLDQFSLPSQPGNERQAMERVARAVEVLDLPRDRLEKLNTAVAEATMNAMEHGNGYRPELPVEVEVLATARAVRVRITDQGGGTPIPEPEMPDLEAKLEGLQTPRGWGLFLIRNMVDDLQVELTEKHHTVELVLYRKGDSDAVPTA